MPTTYKILTQEKQIDTLIEYCKQTGYCSFDFETTGLEFYDKDLYPTILGISFQIGHTQIIPLGHFQSPFKEEYPRILRKFGKAVLEDESIVKIAQNGKFDMKWFTNYGVKIKGRFFDSMLAKYLLDENTRHGLKEMTERFIPEYGGYDDELKELKKKYTWETMPLEPLSEYCGYDCDMTFRLMLWFEKMLIRADLYSLFRNMAMMQSRVLGESEYTGIGIDTDYLMDLMVSYETRIAEKEEFMLSNAKLIKYTKIRNKDRVQEMIDTIQAEIDSLYDYDGTEKKIQNREEKIARILEGNYTSKRERDKLAEPFNVGSPAQLKDFFFFSKKGLKLEIVKYTVDKNTKRETDNPSTDEEVLKTLEKQDKSGFMTALLDYRGLSKLYSTYVKGIYERTYEDRIHTSYKIHGTVTGRLSSVDPNLQNIPRGTTAKDIKQMFIPPEGMLMMEVDYSQAELRIVAEIANETEMIKWFKAGRNIHVAVACKANGRGDDYDEIYPITKDESHPDHEFWTVQKKRAKTINFGILYEQGKNKLAEGLKCTPDEAEQFKEDWFAMFPRVKKWVNKQHKLVEKQGYVKNLFGRKRRLPNIYSNKKYEWAEAQRQSVNTPIQGASSDYTQFSSIVLRELRLKGELPDYFIQHYTVHDSIGYPVKPEDVHWIAKKIVPICANPQTQEWFGFQATRVNMKVSIEIGVNWGEYHDYDPNEDYTKWLNK